MIVFKVCVYRYASPKCSKYEQNLIHFSFTSDQDWFSRIQQSTRNQELARSKLNALNNEAALPLIAVRPPQPRLHLTILASVAEEASQLHLHPSITSLHAHSSDHLLRLLQVHHRNLRQPIAYLHRRLSSLPVTSPSVLLRKVIENRFPLIFTLHFILRESHKCVCWLETARSFV